MKIPGFITTKSFLEICKSELKNIYPEREIESIAKILLEETTGKPSTALRLDGIEPGKSQRHFLENALVRLRNNEPLQHILGYGWFYGYRFKVNRHVLIPRRETEELVDWVIKSVKSSKARILDIGTGSGCIAISLFKELENASVEAWDISEKALEIARINADLLDAEVHFRETDIFSVNELRSKPDVIVSNPPYVLNSEKAKMHPNVTRHEPAKALFVSDEDSLVYYRKIAGIAYDNLGNGGLLFFEINEQKGEEMKELLCAMGFVDVILKNDLQGKPRMIRATKG